MNILHIISNYKWTERSEPAVDMALSERKLGANVFLASGRAPQGFQESIEKFSASKGIESEILDINKHFKIYQSHGAIQQLQNLIARRKINLIHCHMPNAHFITSLAVKNLPGRPAVVRTFYGTDDPEWKIRHILFCQYVEDGIVVTNPVLFRKMSAMLHYNEKDKVNLIEPCIDIKRFARGLEGNAREVFGLAKNNFVIGIVARITRRRHLDVILNAFSDIHSQIPEARLLIIGRGNVEKEVINPAQASGILKKIILGGYCRGDKLVQAYNTMDVLAYPVPGTDKSCRTVKEAMASSVPVIASNMGVLPFLVENNRTGMIVPLDSKAFAAAITRAFQIRNGALKTMGLRARQEAIDRFSGKNQAKKMLAFYNYILSLRLTAMTS